jgi:hypothetical protein
MYWFSGFMYCNVFTRARQKKALIIMPTIKEITNNKYICGMEDILIGKNRN